MLADLYNHALRNDPNVGSDTLEQITRFAVDTQDLTLLLTLASLELPDSAAQILATCDHVRVRTRWAAAPWRTTAEISDLVEVERRAGVLTAIARRDDLDPEVINLLLQRPSTSVLFAIANNCTVEWAARGEALGKATNLVRKLKNQLGVHEEDLRRNQAFRDGFAAHCGPRGMPLLLELNAELAPAAVAELLDVMVTQPAQSSAEDLRVYDIGYAISVLFRQRHAPLEPLIDASTGVLRALPGRQRSYLRTRFPVVAFLADAVSPEGRDRCIQFRWRHIVDYETCLGVGFDTLVGLARAGDCSPAVYDALLDHHAVHQMTGMELADLLRTFALPQVYGEAWRSRAAAMLRLHVGVLLRFVSVELDVLTVTDRFEFLATSTSDTLTPDGRTAATRLSDLVRTVDSAVDNLSSRDAAAAIARVAALDPAIAGWVMCHRLAKSPLFVYDFMRDERLRTILLAVADNNTLKACWQWHPQAASEILETIAGKLPDAEAWENFHRLVENPDLRFHRAADIATLLVTAA